MPIQKITESEADFFNRMDWKVGDIIRGREENGSYFSITTLRIAWIGRSKVVVEEIEKESSTYGHEVFDPPTESASWAFNFRNWEKI